MVDYERDYWSKAKESGEIVVFMKRLTGDSSTVFISIVSFHLLGRFP
jgi:hypothetical protein